MVFLDLAGAGKCNVEASQGRAIGSLIPDSDGWLSVDGSMKSSETRNGRPFGLRVNSREMNCGLWMEDDGCGDTVGNAFSITILPLQIDHRLE